MLQTLSPTTELNLTFDRSNLQILKPYFDINFATAPLNEKIIFFNNLKTVCQTSLGLAHCMQHHLAARTAVQLSAATHTLVNTTNFSDVIGCYSIVKRSDKLILDQHLLNGTKRWFSNIHIADFGVLQISDGEKIKLVYLDLKQVLHEIKHDSFTPIGMEIARAGDLVVDRHQVPDIDILGYAGTQQFFQQSNFTSYCFLTNHYALTKSLFLDIKQYAEKNQCGAEFDLKKLEIDVCSLEMQWQDNLKSLAQTELTNEFWNRRNTQYAFSKKTLISVIQFVLEIGVTYFVDANSPYSQRFRDAITYCSHMHPLYRFGQHFHLLDLTADK
jgi:hypothetical protein